MYLIIRQDKIRWKTKGLAECSDIENPTMDIVLCCDMPEIINDSRAKTADRRAVQTRSLRILQHNNVAYIIMSTDNIPG